MAKTKKASQKAGKPAPRKRVPWNTREILYAVTGYLTTRKETLLFGAQHECSEIAEIIGKIADANGLPKMRGGKIPPIHVPDDVHGITNANSVATVKTKQTDQAPKNPVEQMVDAIISYSPTEQNQFIELFLKELYKFRLQKIQNIEQAQKTVGADHEQALKEMEHFRNVVKG